MLNNDKGSQGVNCITLAEYQFTPITKVNIEREMVKKITDGMWGYSAGWGVAFVLHFSPLVNSSLSI